MLEGIVNPSDYEQVFDVLDVWFDSARPMPSCCATARMGRRTGSPTCTWRAPTSIAAGSIPRLLQACGTKGRAPYRGVLTHGFTLDEKGMKMSKSLGNTTRRKR
jgi:isoleucyl-tRNA synthetase